MEFKGIFTKMTVTGLTSILLFSFVINNNIVSAQADHLEITAEQKDEFHYTADLTDIGDAKGVTVTFSMKVRSAYGDQPINMIINNDGTDKYKFDKFSINMEDDSFWGNPENFEFYHKNSPLSFGLNTLEVYNNKGDDPDFIKEYMPEYIDENGAEFVFNNTLRSVPGNPYGSYAYTVTLKIHLSLYGTPEQTITGNEEEEEEEEEEKEDENTPQIEDDEVAEKENKSIPKTGDGGLSLIWLISAIVISSVCFSIRIKKDFYTR